MKKIIFVCKGNIFRSAIAKGLYNKLAKDGGVAESYGTMVDAQGFSGAKLSDACSPKTISYMEENGVDIRNETAKQLTKKAVDDADVIIVMAEKETWPDYLKKDPKVIYWDVEDVEFINFQTVSSVGEKIRKRIEEYLNK